MLNSLFQRSANKSNGLCFSPGMRWYTSVSCFDDDAETTRCYQLSLMVLFRTQSGNSKCKCVCVCAAASHKMRTLRNCRLMYVWSLFSFLVFPLKLLRNCEIYFVSSQCACNRSCATIIYYYFFHTLLPRVMNLISFPIPLGVCAASELNVSKRFSLIQLQQHYSIS